MSDFLAFLRSELVKPEYAGKTDEEAAGILAGPGAPLIEDRSVIPSHEVWEAIAPADWKALVADEKQRVQTILGMGQVDLSGVNTKGSLAAAFGPATASRTALMALQQRSTPRTLSEELFGVQVGVNDIATARAE